MFNFILKEHNMASEQTTSQIKHRQLWNYLRLNFRVYLKKHHSCIKIQACWRGYNFRKKNVLEPCYVIIKLFYSIFNDNTLI